MKDQRLLLTNDQWSYMERLVEASVSITDVDAYMEANFVKYYTPSRLDVLLNMNDRLGSQNEFRNNRIVGMEEDREVSRIPHFRPTTNYVIFDEPYHSAESACIWRHGTSAQEWVEHRMFCERDVLACLSRKTS